MEELDLEVAGEYLVTAAWLLAIKSRMLLPRHSGEGEEDPREELVERLVEYEKVQASPPPSWRASRRSGAAWPRCAAGPRATSRRSEELDLEDVDVVTLALALRTACSSGTSASTRRSWSCAPMRFSVREKILELFELIQKQTQLPAAVAPADPTRPAGERDLPDRGAGAGPPRCGRGPPAPRVRRDLPHRNRCAAAGGGAGRCLSRSSWPHCARRSWRWPGEPVSVEVLVAAAGEGVTRGEVEAALELVRQRHEAAGSGPARRARRRRLAPRHAARARGGAAHLPRAALPDAAVAGRRSRPWRSSPTASRSRCRRSTSCAASTPPAWFARCSSASSMARRRPQAGGRHAAAVPHLEGVPGTLRAARPGRLFPAWRRWSTVAGEGASGS